MTESARSLGWLVCTKCALVLDEKALVMTGDATGVSKNKNEWAVRGADPEYNAWRYARAGWGRGTVEEEQFLVCGRPPAQCVSAVVRVLRPGSQRVRAGV